MPTDRELEQSALLHQFTPPNTSGTPMPGVQDVVAYINRLRDVVPSVDSDTPLTPTPTTPPLKGKGIPQPEPEDTGELYHTIKDKSGQKVTIISTTGDLRSDADFGVALKNHNTGKQTEGFLVLPKGSYSEGIRRGLYKGTREILPNVGETVGGAIPSKMLELAVKAGLVSPQTQASAVQSGETGGRATANFIGEQVDTPGELGMIAGTAAVAPFAAPVVSGTGRLLKANALLKNPAFFGAGGALGSTSAKIMTSEDQTFSKAAEEFAVSAISGGLQGLVSFGLTKMLKPDTATKVATEMMDAIKKKYPTLVNDPNAFNIANSTPKDISNLTSMMSKALRGDAAEEAEGLLTSLKTALPATPTTAQQATLRAHNRRIIEAQTNALDNIGDSTAFNEALKKVSERKQELMDTIRTMYPGKKNFVATEAALSKHSDYVKTFEDGANLLHHLKQSGADEKFDPMAFAQRIRGGYTKEPDSLLRRIGDILGQGRSLKDLPLPGEAAPGEEMGKKTFNLIRQLLPKGTQWTDAMKYQGPSTPWPTPKGPDTSKVIGAQQAGQAAIKSWFDSQADKDKDRKWKVRIQ
jgi:hypothetical protein